MHRVNKTHIKLRWGLNLMLRNSVAHDVKGVTGQIRVLGVVKTGKRYLVMCVRVGSKIVYYLRHVSSFLSLFCQSACLSTSICAACTGRISVKFDIGAF